MSKAINVIFRKQADSLFDDLAVSLGVKMTFYTSAMETVNRGQHNNLSSFCSLVQNSIGPTGICRDEDRKRCAEARELGGTHAYHCHAGLMEAVVPVTVDDRVLGYALMGQIRNGDSLPESLLELAEKKLGSRVPLLEAYEKLPLFTRDRFDHGLSLFKHIITYMTEENMVAMKSNLVVEKALEYMGDHLNENISLSETADHVGKSPSALSRHFKSQLGYSYKETFLDMKFTEAEKLFHLKPELTIAQISYGLGFSEPAYFSRIYKKYRGEAPRQAARFYHNSQEPPE